MTDFEEKMRELRAEYHRMVAADIGGMQARAAELHGDERDRPVLASLAETLHRIAGGAGVFGLTQLSERTHGLELDLNDRLAAPLAQVYRDALPEFRAALAGLTVRPDV